ncbi:MAG TPA: hypothetical protein VGM74_11065 [Burkholderiaceae bacterium]|jgi:hypothetical protein
MIMKPVQAPLAAAAAVLAAVLVACAPAAAAPEFSGQVRPEWFMQSANGAGPVAQADALQPGVVAPPRGYGAVETELRASGHGLAFVGTERQQRIEGDRLRSHGWVNELYGSTQAGGWQLSAGKRIVGWDVGYGFRPNDVVEQETRRTLLQVTPEGRALLMAEHFTASTAWAFVLVNPTKRRAAPGPDEPALAMRVYQRDGAVDWHGFARLGAHTGASVGAAAAWVASDAIELHASLRYLTRGDTLANTAANGGADATPLAADPWRPVSVSHTAQALVGGTWTNAAQLSVLAEAWWDGTALSDAQWDDWAARNRGLAALVGAPVPLPAIAGNLAWQANAFNASTNLRRANLFGRVSWQYEKWQPSLDMLFTPADRGRVVTAALGWQGDRLRVDAGLRVYGGPAQALLSQTPTRRVAYVASTWTF